ncbi:GTPase Era, partial [Coxiella endosymbiont of Amblyomma americanum]|uniref:GTPase Era n=1 Tax=Coxiella endosymbiont of Amblyomma americanum TaxID=325775 RepID=UPI00058074DD
MNKEITHCGRTVIIGRPNVGKSSLFNQIVGCKISITSQKPQTTRHRILGIKTFDNTQVIYIDTPGFLLQLSKMTGCYANRIACGALQENINLVLFVIEPYWNEQDALVLKYLQGIKVPIFLIINKTDQVRNLVELLPFIKRISFLHAFSEIIPISVKTGDQIKVLERKINEQMPESCFSFPPEQITDRNDQFIAAEIIREKLMRLLNQEIPYLLTVTVIMFQRKENVLYISAIIWVTRRGQKGIVIGKYGKWIKKIGISARIDMEKLFGQKIFLHIWVKFKRG